MPYRWIEAMEPDGRGLKSTRQLVLNLIWETPGRATRAEIARALHLSRSAVSDIVDDLLEARLVREQEIRASRAGRRPIGLELNQEAGQVLGVDIGATHIRVILTDLSARPLAEVNRPFPIERGPELSLAEVQRLVTQALQTGGSDFSRVRAVGVGVPGPVVSGLGMVVAPPIMPGWHLYPIRDTLDQVWQKPVVVHNDANVGALGEWTFGAGRRRRNLVYIKVGTGIGMGMILNGWLHEGEVGAAGEIGHITLVENGLLCTCGNRGCLEALAGGSAIAERARELVRAGARTHLASMAPLDQLTARDVAEAAAQGDHVAQQIFAQAGEYIGIAVAGVVNLLNPGLVVVGGGIAQAGDLLLEPIRAGIRHRALQAAVSAAQVTSASLGQRSSAMGAVAAALSVAFERALADLRTTGDGR